MATGCKAYLDSPSTTNELEDMRESITITGKENSLWGSDVIRKQPYFSKGQKMEEMRKEERIEGSLLIIE